ncbi:MAG: DVUA0089 family protein, partial [Cyanobacteria bacterium J06560_2]
SATIYDTLDDVPALPTVPTVGLSVSETALVESEGNTTTLTFTLDSPPPEGGVTINVDSGIRAALGEFDVFNAEIEGGNFPSPNFQASGFFFTITEQTATITLAAFDETTNPEIPAESVVEGIDEFTFTVQPGVGYAIAPEASAITLTIADNPDSVAIPDEGGEGEGGETPVDPGAEVEFNDTIADAIVTGLNADNPTYLATGEIGTTRETRNFVDRSEDVDMYAFELETGQVLTLDVDAGGTGDAGVEGSLMDSVLRVFDAAGNEVAVSDNDGAADEVFQANGDSYLEFAAPEAGTYYVGISSLGNNFYDPNVQASGSGWIFEDRFEPGEYRLSATLGDGTGGPTPGREGYQPGDSASLVTPPPTYEGALSPGEQANADFVDELTGETLLDELQDGGYVIYFRHAMTERDFADQVTADVTDFSTQRVLSEFGLKQSLAIGEGFELADIPINQVITSEYGRAVKTAAIAFGEYQKNADLNFLPFEDYTDAQIEEMRALITPFLTAEPGAGTNTVIVGHDDLFEAGAGIYPDPQGIAYVLDPDGNGGFDVVANLLPEEWAELAGNSPEESDAIPTEPDGGIGDGAGSIPTGSVNASGWTPGDSVNLVTPTPVYEGELSSGEQANADFVDALEGEALLEELQDGGHVIYFRHAMTERDFADQVTADVTDFSTQRVVSEFGVKQSLAIGEGFDLGEIPFDEVITSEYGRAVETAAIAFGEYQKDAALNFLPFEDYTDAQVEEMRANITPFLTAVPEAGTNTVIVGHDDLFEAGAGIYPDPQGIAYVLTPDGNGSFEIVANLLPEEWAQLSVGTNVNELIGTDERDRLLGTEADDIINALAGNDRLFGNGGDDRLNGSSGRDFLNGGEGNDTLDGGTGQDRMFGKAGDDILTGGSGPDRLFGGAGQDILFGGTGQDRMFGGEDRDILIGDVGNDFLSGGAGDDVLMGVTGTDTLFGNEGADLFVFGTGDGTDKVRDFEVGTDKIGLVEGELTFADLTITQAGHRTLLGVSSSGETLAILQGVEASSLSESSFEVVSNVATVEEALALL